MKKLSKEDKYYLEMLEYERQYRARTGGEDRDTPFVTPLLFAIRDTLRTLLVLLGLLLGCFLTMLLK